MKSLLAKVGVISVFLLLVFGYAEGWGADWKGYAEIDAMFVYYDAKGITRPSKDVVRVWEKRIYKEKGIIEMVEKFGKEYETLTYSLGLSKYHCAEKKMRTLSFIHYSTDGGEVYIALF